MAHSISSIGVILEEYIYVFYCLLDQIVVPLMSPVKKILNQLLLSFLVPTDVI